jgi:hypothetical protein
MVKIVGNTVWRGEEKAGWIEGDKIRAHDGTKLGYFEGNFVYSEGGHKLAYIEGDYLVTYGGGSKVPLEKVSEEVEGGVLPEIGKCAVYVLLGG